MKTYKYFTVDVFAENRFEGNQLAVFMNASDLSDDEMLKIAKEINYAEVSFVLSNEKRNGGFDVRIFTPEEEVPFAGHPSLGTAFIINEMILKDHTSSILLNLKAGTIEVTLDQDEKNQNKYWVNQLNPIFSDTFPVSKLAEILNIDEDQFDERFPIQQVSTGLPTVVIPVKTLDSLTKCRLDREKYFQFVNHIEAKLLHVFSPETHHPSNQLNVRNFGDYYGVSEEPATGSANGCLAGYLIKHRYFGTDKIDIRVEQGREINRLGHLYLRAEKQRERIDVQIGGKAWLVSHGEFYL